MTTTSIEKIRGKLEILADAAKYDASCSSSGGKRKRQSGGMGNSEGTGICHSYTPDGRCISLLKILLTNFCIYDCKYCFLQGMFNSANFVVFVNLEDFMNEIKVIDTHSNDKVCFFSGYDCDSLALEEVTSFLDYFIDHFRTLKNSILEIRTKSAKIDIFSKKRSSNNVIVAYSLNPELVVKNFESNTPSLSKRIKAIKCLQEMNWKIGLRFDPLIKLDKGFEYYRDFFKYVFSNIDANKIHSVTIGKLRFPDPFLKKILKIKHTEPYLNEIYIKSKYEQNQRDDLNGFLNFCIAEINKFIDGKKLFIN